MFGGYQSRIAPGRALMGFIGQEHNLTRQALL